MVKKKILITGGAGFIGSHVVRLFVNKYPGYQIINFDKLTYAGNLENLKDVEKASNYVFVKGDLRETTDLDKVFADYDITDVIHLAAESHVDRSISGPMDFVLTNVVGTVNLLNTARKFWGEEQNHLFYHISTDEVYGSLGKEGLFSEETAYDPRSPYSASKASSDHFVRAYHETYGLPTVITNCSNNYGPYHFPEKLIPLVILNALDMKPLPIYGKGDQIRDWLFVEDHARALYQVVTEGVVGETYNIGGHNEKQNIEVVKTICKILDELKPESTGQKYETLITFVKDRPGHDLRYAIDAAKIEKELGWTPQETFETGIRKTVAWYLNNLDWCHRVQDGSYQRERLGVNA